MKKDILMLMAAAALMLSACGGSNEGDTGETAGSSAAQQSASGSVDPAYAAMAGEIAAVDPKRPDSLGEISLGEYKGVDIEAEEAGQVTNDEAIIFIENNVLPYYLEDTGEPAAEGDTVTIDFAGTMDGVAFDGGTAEGQTFVLGMGGYIDGFEDGIVGMKAGETRDVDVTFPEDYGNAELAGKPATFAITVSSVQNQRELDDELAQELNSECSTREEYISFVRDILQEEADNNAEYALYDNAVQAVIAGCSELSPSEEAIDWRMDETIKSDDLMLQSTYGIGLADYLSMYGVTLDDYRDSIRENCTEQVRQYLVTEAICDAEGFEAGEAELEEWAAQNGVDMETVNATYDEDEAAIRCRAYLAAKFIAENGNILSSEAYNESLINEYETGVSYDNLARTPDDFIGEKVKFSGEVVQIASEDKEGDTEIRLAVDGDYDNILYCTYESDLLDYRILEGDTITVYGVSEGLYSYTSTMGAEITIPAIEVNRID